MSETEDTKQCTNCKLDILSSNYIIHSVHCQRNFYLCSLCKQPVNYSQKLEHDEEYHVVVKCKSCNLELEKWKLKEHQTLDCPYRKVNCQICDIEVELTEIGEHENYCGSRTEKCEECGELVMLRYKALHIDSNHTFIKLSDEPGPSPSWQHGRATLCNFMPDLTSKNYKSSHKRRSNENRRSRNSGSRNSSESDKGSVTSPNKNENCEIDMKIDDVFKVKEKEKPFKKDADDWSTLSSLRSLRISEDNKPRSKADEESDLMYAIQVSRELNSHMWEKDSAAGVDEALKNSYRPPVERQRSQSKNVDKNLFARRTRRKVSESEVNGDLEDNFFLCDEGNFELDAPIKLPCEFCGTFIVSHELIFHQSRCNFLIRKSFDRGNSRHKFSSFAEDIDKKIPCGICNKFFKLSAFENHQIHCQRNLTRSWKNQEKTNYARNMKSVNVKSEPGLQNGVEQSSPRLSRVGTRSEWLTELSKNSNEGESDFKNNLNRPESGAVTKTSKVSRKNRRAPSPPKM